ncbi:MAG: glutamate--tRNA ligase [Acidimicrobiia bacterium]|nr:glutamate--tRNA ligase [Acidimicrobiia bacterium]
MIDASRPIRVRFAPSPTGYLHVGGGRTALYNWLFARRYGGTFILRSDDTDRERSTDEFAADIIESMRWLGLDWDEGIEVGGPQPTYHQSERFARYQAVAHQLLADGRAYYSFASPEQLDTFRKEAQAAGLPPAYDGRFRVDADEAARRIAAGERAPIRFAVERPGVTEFADLVRGDMRFEHVQVDDFVILRSDGSPTYHLASTVDDVDFDISHVVRGEDLLSSTPKHILLTEAMGSARATYAHLPLLRGPDGAKLSKRHGHTSINSYRDAGFLAEALRNYLAILSWSPGDDEEIVSLADMADRFELTDVSKNPAVFDVTKLEWMNGVYIRELSGDGFVGRVRALVEADLGRELAGDDVRTLEEILPHVQERAKVLTEIPEQVRFLFGDITYDETSWDKVMRKDGADVAVAGASEALDQLSEWSIEAVEGALRAMLETHELSARKGLQPLRVAVTGSSISPPLFESIAALGRDRTLERLSAASAKLAEAM